MYRFRTATLCLLIVATGLIAGGIGKLEIETNFINNFRANSRLALDYSSVESTLGGAGVWDILLPSPNTVSTEYLASVRALEDSLRAIQSIDGQPGLTKVLSIADADQAAASSMLLKFMTPELRLAGMQTAMPRFVRALLTPAEMDQPYRSLRIMLRSREQVDAVTKRRLIADVNQTVLSHCDSDQWRALFPESAASPVPEPLVTGYYVLLTGLVGGLVDDQWICFAIASIGVFLTIAVATRSVRLALCAMLPNILPILGVMAALGWWSEPVNIGTAMIAAVSIGISIDGSIHFLIAYRRNRLTRGVATSIDRVFPSVGIAVLVATLALVLGFSCLITSPFVPTATFGLLVSVSLVISTIANLTLLPAAIRILD